MTARLHVLLGDGGVGKTTLAAGYALALAARGRRVALLGVDPALRLQTALGLPLDDAAARVPVPGELVAAHLVPALTLRRWAIEELTTDAERARVLENPFFSAIAERLAATTDVIGAVRIAEWLEEDPSLTDVVVDTAPGRNGIELLIRPDALLAAGSGRLMAWMRHLRARPHDRLGGVGGRVLGGLGRIAGTNVLADLVDLVAAVEAPARRFAARLERARLLLRAADTERVLVTAVRADASRSAARLLAKLEAVGLPVTTVAVNDVLRAAAPAELDALDHAAPDEATGILRYVRAHLELEAVALEHARTLARRVVVVPSARDLDGADRLARLGALGAHLVD